MPLNCPAPCLVHTTCSKNANCSALSICWRALIINRSHILKTESVLVNYQILIQVKADKHLFLCWTYYLFNQIVENS